MGHHREPIKNTCPDIDKVIEAIRSAQKETAYKSHEEADELRSRLEEIERLLWDAESQMEGLRRSNSALREWATDEAEEVDKLQELIDKDQ